jgi:hypothetical protein
MEEEFEHENCDACGYPTKNLKKYEFAAGKEPGWLCECCAGTYAGNAFFYPEQYDNIEIMRQISYCTNMILDKLRDIPHNIKGIPGHGL